MADHLRLEEAALLRELRRPVVVNGLEDFALRYGPADDELVDVDEEAAQEAFEHFIGMTEDRL